jgi:hypothetical protein
MTLSTLFLIFALVLFIVAIFPLPIRFNLIAAGLACWVFSVILGSGVIH